MASLTQWTWVWVNLGSWWWTGRPGVLWFMGSQRIGHDWAIELILSLHTIIHVSLFSNYYYFLLPNKLFHSVYQSFAGQEFARVRLSGSRSVLVKKFHSKGLIVARRPMKEMALFYSYWQEALVSHFMVLSIGVLSCFPDMAGNIPECVTQARRQGKGCNGLTPCLCSGPPTPSLLFIRIQSFRTAHSW